MRKCIFLLSLVVFSILALGVPLFSAFASEPGIVVTPDTGPLGSSFNFDITATSFTINYEIEVEDPDGTTWRLWGLTSSGWRWAAIWLPDSGDSVRVTWPTASLTVLNDPDGDVAIRSLMGLPMTALEWRNEDGDTPHTTIMGTYSVSFSGMGCKYFTVDSFLVVPESIFGTISVLLVGFASFAVMYARSRPRLSTA